MAAPNTLARVLTPPVPAYDTKVDHGLGADTAPKVLEAAAVEPAIDAVALKSAIRKVDIRLLPLLGALYLFAYMDRGALANASIFGFKEDLHISTTQYNLISMLFFIVCWEVAFSCGLLAFVYNRTHAKPYALLEVPANIVLHLIKPSYWIALIAFSWGTVMTLSGLVHNFDGAMAARFFLGVTEAGFFPAAVSIVSNWYPRHQLQSRIAGFYVIGVFSGAFSGLLAYAISYMEGVGGLASWRWIFILLGLATVSFVPLIFVLLPNDVQSCRWLTPEEKIAMTASRASIGMSDEQHFELRYLLAVARDYKVYLFTFIYASMNVVLFGLSFTLPTILVQLGYRASVAQLMTVPLYGSACIVTFLAAWLSDRIKLRSPVIVVGLVVTLIGMSLCYALPKDRNPVARYIACLLVFVGAYPIFPAVISWNANSTNHGGKRNIYLALQLTIGNLSSIIGINSYVGSQAPYYQAGFGTGLAVTAASLFVVASLILILKRENKKLDKKAELSGEDDGFRYIF